jgi:hypothetical protein
VVDPVPPDPLQAATAASTMATHTQPMGLSRNRNANLQSQGQSPRRGCAGYLPIVRSGLRL